MGGTEALLCLAQRTHACLLRGVELMEWALAADLLT
jgi:hypothetical protein